MLLEYIYLPQEDEKDINSLWQEFSVEDENITIMGLDYEIKNGYLSAGCIQRAEAVSHNRNLYFYKNIAIIVIEQHYSTADNIPDILFRFSEKLSAFDSLIGHSTILVNPTEEEARIYSDHYDLNNKNAIQLKNGEISLFSHDLEDFHQLLTYNGNNDDTQLFNNLPVLLANIFNLTQKTRFYNDQNHTIAHEKSQVDSKIGSVMQLKFSESSANKNKLDMLETTVHSLADMYSVLSSNATVLLSTQLALEKDSHIATSLLDKLTNDKNNYFYQAYVQQAENVLKNMYNLLKQLQISISNAKTSIDILQAQINLIRSHDNLVLQQQMSQVLGQTLELQQEAVTLQIGAGLIEFIVVMYYSLSIWKTLAPDSLHHLPGIASLGIVIAFASLVVFLTHKVSKRIINKKHKEPNEN